MTSVDFAADAAAGMSINALAKKHGMTWAQAKKVRDEIADGPAPEVNGEEVQVYPLSLEVPLGKISSLLRSLTPDELISAIEVLDEPSQVQIFQIVLQRRLDAALESDDRVLEIA